MTSCREKCQVSLGWAGRELETGEVRSVMYESSCVSRSGMKHGAGIELMTYAAARLLRESAWLDGRVLSGLGKELNGEKSEGFVRLRMVHLIDELLGSARRLQRECQLSFFARATRAFQAARMEQK